MRRRDSGSGPLDAAPEPPPGPRRRRTLTPGGVSGTWGHTPPRLRSAGAHPGRQPWDASGPPAPGKRREGTRSSSQGRGSLRSFREDRLEEQVLALPVVGRPQQRRFLEIQITGCGGHAGSYYLEVGVMLFAGEVPSDPLKKSPWTDSFAPPPTPTVCQHACRRWTVNKTDKTDTVYDLTGTNGL